MHPVLNLLLGLTMTTISNSIIAKVPKIEQDRLPRSLERQDNQRRENPNSNLGIRAPPFRWLEPPWQLDWYEYDHFMVPVQGAAGMLEDFYQRLARYALTTDTPGPSHTFLAYGQLEFEISCPNSVVAWETVYHFAQAMIIKTRLGNVSTFHCNLFNPATGVLITFNLFFRPPRAD